jgi:serine/threonine protein kinase
VSSSLEQQLQAALGDAYVLERELGGGGMSRVFLAHESALGRRVVIKVLLPELAAGVSVERFRREIQLAAQLQHPHIVPLLSAGEAEGLPYFIMPFVVGESLRTRVSREGELPIAEMVRILRDVVSALVYAHARGVVHRDIKPDNVLLSGGVAVVTDFGVAKAVSASSENPAVSDLTSLGVALGTPAYMAPEQATASPQTDHRADIYALGAMAYEMLTGAPPFSGRSPQAVLAAHVVEEPPPVELRRPGVPTMLASLVRECLAKRPADRPQSASDVMYALDSIATPTGGTAPTTAILPVREIETPRSRKWPLVGALATLAAFGAAAVLLLGRPHRTAIPPARVTEEQGTVTPPPADTAASKPAASPAPPDQPPASPVTERERARPPKSDRSGTVRRERPKPSAEPVPVAPQPAAESDSAVSTVQSRAPSAALAPATPVPPAAAESAAGPPITPSGIAPAPTPAPATTPAPAPVDQRPAIRKVINDYSSAIEAQSLNALRQVYPGMTPLQQRGWEQFFQVVRDVKAQLTVGQLDVGKDTASAQVTGTYIYRNTTTGRTEQQPVAFNATFKRDSGQWLISEVR